MEEGIRTGQWSMVKILGQGSYGSVSLWKHNDEYLAVKKFEVRTPTPPSQRLLSDLQDRFKKEVDIMYNQIDSPYIVATIKSPEEITIKLCEITSNNIKKSNDNSSERNGDSSNSSPITALPLLTMEYCKGGDLRQMLKRPENLSGLNEKQVLNVLSHISSAISYLHQKQICHRDIKPENIVIQYADNSYTKPIYKLSDLGFAKDFTDDSQFATILGTLPYLAPEIFTSSSTGSKYDKTVDYWSFGLIAFEVCCGIRPFLPSESAAIWIPLVEKKQKDVISIWRGDDGSINYSNDIHYNNHLSQLIRKCIVAWLPSMLQLDPKARGKYVLTQEEAKRRNGEGSALVRLRNMLNTKFLHIHTLTDRHVFAIGNHTKISEVQNWIARSTGISPHEQLILTFDGVDIAARPLELAVKYMELSSDLFLLSRKGVESTIKMKLPKSLKYYLTSWDEQHELAKIRKVWTSAIYFVQTHVERGVTSLKKASEALKMYHTKYCTAELKNLVSNVEKTSYSLNNLCEMEERLEQLESKYKDNLQMDTLVLESTSSLKTEGENLRAYSKECFDGWSESVSLGQVKISELEDIYHKLIKAYDMWKTAESEGKRFEMKILVQYICQFIAQWDPFVSGVLGNIKILLEKIAVDEDLNEKLSIVISKLNSLIDTVMERRLKKQRYILNHGFNNGEDLFSNPVVNGIGNTTTNTNGTNHSDHNQMSKSHYETSSRSASRPSHSSSVSPEKVMSRSCYVGSRKNSLVTPDFLKLMEETVKVKEDMEENVNNAISKVQEILRKKSESWEKTPTK